MSISACESRGAFQARDMRRDEAAALPDVTLELVRTGHAPLTRLTNPCPSSCCCYNHIAAMLIRSIGAALLTAGAANAFHNAEPFLMLSTKPYETPLATASQADD
jgi:hypothetical protein